MRCAGPRREQAIYEEKRNVAEIERVARRKQREHGVGNVVDLRGKPEVVQGEEVRVKAHMQDVGYGERRKGEVKRYRAGETQAARQQRKRRRERSAE